MVRAHAARLAYLEDTRAHQAEVIARLQAALAKHEDYIGAVTVESQARHQELSKAETYVASLLVEIDKLRGEVKSVGDYATDLRQALEASERRLLQERQRMGDALEADRNRALREREEERMRLTRDLEEERTHLTRALEDELAARELARQEQVIAWMKTSIETYEHSRSWRVTAALRAGARLFGRLRHPR
jgi:uncharacterized coiled-coil protein SlyX